LNFWREKNWNGGLIGEFVFRNGACHLLKAEWQIDPKGHSECNEESHEPMKINPCMSGDFFLFDLNKDWVVCLEGKKTI